MKNHPYMPDNLKEAQKYIRLLREERNNLLEQVDNRSAYIKVLGEQVEHLSHDRDLYSRRAQTIENGIRMAFLQLGYAPLQICEADAGGKDGK